MLEHRMEYGRGSRTRKYWADIADQAGTARAADMAAVPLRVIAPAGQR